MDSFSHVGQVLEEFPSIVHEVGLVDHYPPTLFPPLLQLGENLAEAFFVKNVSYVELHTSRRGRRLKTLDYTSISLLSFGVSLLVNEAGDWDGGEGVGENVVPVWSLLLCSEL